MPPIIASTTRGRVVRVSPQSSQHNCFVLMGLLLFAVRQHLVRPLVSRCGSCQHSNTFLFRGQGTPRRTVDIVGNVAALAFAVAHALENSLSQPQPRRPHHGAHCAPRTASPASRHSYAPSLSRPLLAVLVHVRELNPPALQRLRSISAQLYDNLRSLCGGSTLL